MKLDLKLIIAESKKLGLDLVSCIDPEFLIYEKERLARWQESQYAGEMNFMKRSPDMLCNPRVIFPEVKSVLVFALYYDRTQAPEFRKGYGRVARYAWGKDYHKIIRKQLGKLLIALKTYVGEELQFRAFSDSVPLLERALARKAGLGFVGKNSMLIKPKSGSYFFIAEILSNLEVQSDSLPVIEESCGSCTNCKDLCPTGAIVEDRVIDARKCISYLTIEKKGMLNIWERESIKEWVFGCDVCQDVCPFNHKSLKSQDAPALDEFKPERGVGALLDLNQILSFRTNEQYIKNFAGTALMRAGRECLLRNAAFVGANTYAENLKDALTTAFLEDSSEVVRASSFWSLSKINHKCNIFTKAQMDGLTNRATKNGAIKYGAFAAGFI